MSYDSYKQDDPLNQPNSKDKDTENPDTIKKRKPGRPKNNVWNFFIELDTRVQGHCGAKCKEYGWEKKANAKTDDLETHFGLRYIKVDYKIKEQYMNIIRDQENLGQSIDNNNQSSKKVKLNHDHQHQQQINEHYESLNINNSKV